MGVRDESMEFQRWLWNNYGYIRPIVSDEIHAEYCEYRMKQREKQEAYLLLIAYAVIVGLINILLWRLLCLTGFITL